MFKVVSVFIGLVFALVICWYLFVAVVGVKVVKEIDKNGVKGIVERVWNGAAENHGSAPDSLQHAK